MHTDCAAAPAEIAQAGDPEEPATRSIEPARLSGRRDRLVLAIVWLLAALYTGACLKRGWVPSDAGMFGQTAERVLHGQVPFHDFIEPYSGGLTYLNALAFRLLGVNLLSIRIPLFILFLGWLPVFYWLARRFAEPLAAGLATLLAVAWSLPNYTEAMPSWYNLFFATFGAAALLRYIETRRQRWLWIAGLCGGLSIVVKITGLYFIAAGLLFFAFREQSLVRQTAAAPPKRAWLYRAFLTVCLALFIAVLLDTVWLRPSLATFVHFVVPGACLAALLLWREYRLLPRVDGARFRSLFSMALPFLTGALIPTAALLLWYVHADALRGYLLATVVLVPQRMQWMATDPVPLLFVAGLLPAFLIFFAAGSPRASTRRAADRGAPVLFAALLLAAWKSWMVYELFGFSVSLIIPLLAFAALAWLRPSSAVPKTKTDEVFPLVSVAVLCALVQFPFGQPTYFYYVAPLAILALLALGSLRPVTGSGRVAVSSLVGFYLVFALWLAPPGFWFTNGIGTPRHLQMQTLPFARAGGIRVVPQQEQEYAQLVPLVQAHTRGPFIYAVPDCPEVYFLSGLRNPTPALFDFLDPDFFDLPARTERILGTIQSHGVRVVVLKDSSAASGALPAALRAALDARFPQSARVDDFEVRWKP
jgi:hypothetical protein